MINLFEDLGKRIARDSFWSFRKTNRGEKQTALHGTRFAVEHLPAVQVINIPAKGASMWRLKQEASCISRRLSGVATVSTLPDIRDISRKRWGQRADSFAIGFIKIKAIRSNLEKMIEAEPFQPPRGFMERKGYWKWEEK